MKTTLVIADPVMRKLKRAAATRGRTMSELVEAALRRFLDEEVKLSRLPPLPTVDTGGARVDIADREALYQAMEGR
ncbi:MAG: hypothetical protein A2289_24735 [Deltaproteobacteria bacterium RIFOXYA12_FULL_58_15]|nr:MAG: hypothetical protein A2289_24735 [Deltaproteobacteria bacterium RIFOXYA12_FULL_58_15]OGR12685.1 MAG: hypothetical protein A2341_07680 [Deltaproteobacteria bacterium RIFOXYB12_FULL_58_9]